MTAPLYRFDVYALARRSRSDSATIAHYQVEAPDRSAAAAEAQDRARRGIAPRAVVTIAKRTNAAPGRRRAAS